MFVTGKQKLFLQKDFLICSEDTTRRTQSVSINITTIIAKLIDDRYQRCVAATSFSDEKKMTTALFTI